jgi:dinuclear metal center YbgI/SA1388 family protein
MEKISDIISAIEQFAPLHYQEDYDNSGLLCGSAHWEAKGAVLSLDCTEAVVDEAIAKKCNLIIAHHPLIFGGIKRLSGDTYVERAIIKAIKNDIAIYACHTNIDNVEAGVNHKIAEKLGLVTTRILAPKNNLLKKLVTYVPPTHHQQVLSALFDAGAGHIGKYDHCSFSTEGEGSFRGNEHAQPFIGEAGKESRENEIRVETIFPADRLNTVKKALLGAHPYEEVAFDIYSLDNTLASVGSGMVGELSEAMTSSDFLNLVKKTFKVPFVKYTNGATKTIKKVAICGGSGRFLLKNAISSGAEAFITADFKYHEYFDAQGKILLVDTGHYETEQFTPEIFYEIIRKKFSTFAIHLSEINTNPVNYF